MKTIHSELVDKLGDIISAAIQHIHDIFAAQRPAATVTDSISKQRNVVRHFGH
jgi:hypothetical protein